MVVVSNDELLRQSQVGPFRIDPAVAAGITYRFGIPLDIDVQMGWSVGTSMRGRVTASVIEWSKRQCENWGQEGDKDLLRSADCLVVGQATLRPAAHRTR
jgi:hypothetical protein